MALKPLDAWANTIGTRIMVRGITRGDDVTEVGRGWLDIRDEAYSLTFIWPEDGIPPESL